MPSTRLLVLTAAAGARGAITLAGILTLPLLMPDSSPFPARDAAISIAMGVILFSLLIASVALKAERDELFILLRANAIDESVFQQLVREIDLMESSLARASH